MPSHTSNTNNSCLYGGNESLLITASNNALSNNGSITSIDEISNADKDKSFINRMYSNTLYSGIYNFLMNLVYNFFNKVICLRIQQFSSIY